MPKLLVIDDDPLILKSFRFVFPTEEVEIHTAGTAAAGLQSFQESRPAAVLADVRLPDQSGLDLFRHLRAIDPKVPVILMTGHGSADTAIEAMRAGAFDYLTKPIDPDTVVPLVERAFAIHRLMSVPAIVPSIEPSDDNADTLVGNSPAMQDAYKSIGRVAPQDVTVLVLGESGTGKEMVVRAIYHYSKRADRPFLAINCAAIPETLLESELFGHEKGAFTGAERRRIGKFEQCHGGTLFLDEIGDMTPLTQSKILRVLQDQSFERVGGNETIRADVRVIAATHRDLEALVAAGKFRSDLFYRLNVFTIHLPPLRERVEDIPLLANHFLRRFNRELGKEVTSIAPETLELLRAYRWPGNIREFQSVLKQALLRASGPVLLPEFLSVGSQAVAEGLAAVGSGQFADVLRFVRERISAGTTDLLGELTAATERVLLEEVMKQAEGNVSRAGRILGISRPTLRSKLSSLLPEAERNSGHEEG